MPELTDLEAEYIEQYYQEHADQEELELWPTVADMSPHNAEYWIAEALTALDDARIDLATSERSDNE